MTLEPSGPDSLDTAAPECSAGKTQAAASPSGWSGETGSRSHTHRMLWAAGWLILGALAGALALWLGLRDRREPMLMRFEIDLPPEAPLSLKANSIAFSPDGSLLVYVALVDDDTFLYMRALDRTEARPIPGTKSACSPFFSPDGAWIGYFDARDAKLKKVALAGGEPVVLGKAQPGFGACWLADGTIIYAPDGFSGLWRLSAGGGEPAALTRLKPGESTHRWPKIMPDNNTVLYSVGLAGTAGIMQVAAFSLRTGQSKVLLDRASDARYSPTRQLLFLRGGNLMAVGFDPARLRIEGSPFLVKEGLKMVSAAGAGHYDCSVDGALAYVQTGEEEDLRSLVWADRQGGFEKVVVTRGAFTTPRLSPDGQQIAVVIRSLEGQSNLWLVDPANGAFTRLTFEANSICPVWTPDGRHLTFASDRNGQWNLYWEPVDLSGPAELLNESPSPQMPNAWSPDGRFLAFTEIAPDSGPDIWVLSGAGPRVAQPFLRTQFSEWGGTFSADGRWLAYTSDDSGPPQVFARPFPGSGERIQLSTAEGREPVWGRDGKEVFYRYWNGLMSVGIQTVPEFNPDPPRLILSGEFETGVTPAFPNYDVSLDGQRFVMIPREPREKKLINIDLNWFRDRNTAGSPSAGDGGSPVRKFP